METKSNISKECLDVLKCLINGRALAVSKKKPEAYLVFGDYSFYKDVHLDCFNDLRDLQFIKRIDSRVSSYFFSISDRGIKYLNDADQTRTTR